jgi:exportin-1
MVILKLLSEEIFDFSRGELTQAKTKELKNSLNNQFQLIHELCLFVLQHSTKAELIKATLAALHAYLSWVPLGYIFESNIINLLLQAFPQPAFRNVALQCLTEVRRRRPRARRAAGGRDAATAARGGRRRAPLPASRRRGLRCRRR